MILVKVKWEDAHNNQGAWLYGQQELEEFATDNRFVVTQVGYVAYEDGDCMVIASRITDPEDPETRAYGQVERLPKRLIKTIEEIKDERD